MASLIKKIKKGKPYYYIVECKRVDGKPRIVNQHYIGSVEKILEMHQSKSAPVAMEVDLSRIGPMALYDVATSLDIPRMIDEAFPKREQGPSTSQFLLLAALGRAFDPCSKVKVSGWYEKTCLRRTWGIKPEKFSSQSFWNAMDAIDLKRLSEVEKKIYLHAAREEKLNSEFLLFDQTNYFTFIDTLNERNQEARRGWNKQKRNNLRQLGLAAAVTSDFHIPVYHCLYPGNLNDITQFKDCFWVVADRAKDISGKARDLTVVFDKGNMSEEILFYVADQKIFIIGSTPASRHPEFGDVALEKFKEVSSDKLSGVRAWRTKKEIAGKEWTLVIAHSSNFAAQQYQSIATSQAKAVVKLEALVKKVRRGEAPYSNVKKVKRKVSEILAAQYMKKIIKTEVLEKGDRVVLKYALDQNALKNLIDFQLGRTLLITNRDNWSNEKIIVGYRGQFEVEQMFKESKDRQHLSFQPARHWTDQKLHVHAFYCMLAQLLSSILRRRLASSGIEVPTIEMLEQIHNIMEATLFYPPSKKGPPRLAYAQVRQNRIQSKLFKILDLKKYLRQKRSSKAK